MKKITDLIYSDFKAEEIITNHFKNVTISDESDMVHTERFSIEINDNISKDDYLIFLIRTGLFEVSFMFQMEIKTNPNKITKILKKLENG